MTGDTIVTGLAAGDPTAMGTPKCSLNRGVNAF
jgi:hypothetical protein